MLSVINGDGRCRTLRRKIVPDVMRRVLKIGYTIGRKVKIGTVFGVVIGYNIGEGGEFPFWSFPLLIATDMGVAKCSPSEVTLA